jgi:peptidoglycan L-alanyl-D-glutamate endopeptidase CwlK
MDGKLAKRVEFLYKVGKLIQYAQEQGIALICTCFWRSQQDQDRYYAEGKTKVKRSKHQDWLAIDLAVVNDDGKIQWAADGRYQKLGEYWESLGGIWGGRWQSLRDIYHFEI